jgi:hypothetical protein
MRVIQRIPTTFRLDAREYHAETRVEEVETGRPSHPVHYRAVLEQSPLHGAHSADEDSVLLALDFLNLAMQAMGAEQIFFAYHDEQERAA